MAARLMYHLFSSLSLLTIGIYNLICSSRAHLKTPREYTAKPYHPLAVNHRHLRRAPLYLLIFCLLVSFIHQTVISFESDPLLKGRTPVHLFTSLQSSAVHFSFLLLASAVAFLHLPDNLIFAIAAAAFHLSAAVSASSAAVQTSDLQAKCDSVSSLISSLSALSSFALAFRPSLFVADVALSSSVCLQGLWALQTGLTLYVDAFVPEGCHKLLDVVGGVEGSTKCDLDDSKLRAVAILDLVFVLHVMFVMVVVVVVYAAVGKTGGIRKFGSYDALPHADSEHIQMKALTGTQA